MSASLLQKLTTKAILITGTSLAIVAGGFATLISHSAGLSAAQVVPQRIKLQTTSKSLHLSDAQVIAANGSEQATAQPLALATADFDEDGMPDVIGGYANSGVGFVSLYRGNVEAIYPNRKTEATGLPFAAASQSLNLPAPPDFIITGDFNADGHADVVATARGSNALFLLAGDGKGAFAEPQTMELNGDVTALAAGEINRVDGLSDFAVALKSRDGAQVHVYAAAEGAWKAQPQSYPLAHTASALAFAHLTRDAYSDLAIAAGNELDILTGRNQTATLKRQALSFTAQSLAIGRFTDDTQNQVALLARDGSISVANSIRTSNGRQTARTRNVEQWQVKSWLTASTSAARLEGAASQLLSTRVSGNKRDDLLLLQGNQLQFVTHQDAPQLASASLESQDDFVAALPLRTDTSALQGLVLLSRARNAPMVVRPVPEATFAVDSVADLPDFNPGDGICNSSRAGAPACTLRAAIDEANATAGADTITFNIGTGTQTILLNSPLPTIVNPLVIDGTAQGGAPASQSIVISPGPNFTGGSTVLLITGSNNTIRGLTITGFSFASAIGISGGSGNVIEGNTLQNNGINGVNIDQAANNLIGGTTAAARNVIARSSTGIALGQATATGNRILGNYIGTDSTGTKADANGYGISLFNATNNTIGGTAAGARNVISGNILAGVNVSGVGATFLTEPELADGNVIQGNYIGVDATGTGALGNGFSDGSSVDGGILISAASNTTIGGTSPTAGNVIANNGLRGVSIPTPTFTPAPAPAVNNAILNNSIYSNGALGIDLGTAGVTPNDVGDADTGSNNLQNFPTITSALTRTTGTTINGTLNSAANSTYTIEIFSNAGCDPSGNGEGETFRGRVNVTTNASGVGNFSLVTAPIVAGVNVVTATATDAAGNTSEFSPCFAVRNAVADLGVTVTATPNPVLVGNNLTYNITVSNAGPDDATGVTLTDNIAIPNGQFILVSVTPSAGTCTGTGPITCNLGTIAPAANATVSIVIAPTINTAGSPPQSVTATNTASVTSNEQDTNTANNAASVGATVNASADLAITQTVNPSPAVSGAALTYTVTVTNNGPSTAGFVSGRIDPPVQLANATCTAPAGWSCNRDGNPFFISTSNFAPSTAVITISGTLACLGQNATLTSTATISSQTMDIVTPNNSSTVTSTGQAGAAIGTITYDAGGTALSLGPVVAGSTGTPPSGTFTLTNTGCLPMNLTTAFFQRVSNAGNLSGVDDSRYFSLRLIPTTGAEIPLNPTPNPDRNAPQPISINRTLLAGQQLRFRILFNPPLPAFAGAFTGVFANHVLPDLFNSQLRFNFVTGDVTPPPPGLEAAGDPGTVTAGITARVSPAIQIIPRDGNAIGNPAVTPLVEMTTIRNDFRVKVSLYDANKNATKITYQFFDTYRQVASSPLEVNLTTVLSSLSSLLPGQPFTLQQDFSGASGRPDITYVRVVVTDADGTTVSASSSPFIPALASPAVGLTAEGLFTDVLKLPGIRLAPRTITDAKREN